MVFFSTIYLLSEISGYHIVEPLIHLLSC
jgi:hypothetical protein